MAIDLRRPDPWEQMLPNLVQMYAQGLMQQHFQKREPQPGFTLSPGQVRFGARGVEKARVEPSPVDKWEKLTPIKIGGATIYRQRNIKTGKVEYNRFAPETAKGVEVQSKRQQILVRQQTAGLKQINSLLKKAGIKDLDVLELMALEGPAQMEYLQQQTKPLIERLAEPHKSQLRRYYKKVEDITIKIVGPLPSVPIDQVTAESIFQEAGGNIEEARKIAKERGYVY